MEKSWNLSESLRNEYLTICLEASQFADKLLNFRSTQIYNIVESGDERTANMSFNYINKNHPSSLPLIEKYQAMDCVGKPKQFPAGGYLISDNLLRYIEAFARIKSFIGDLSGMNIVEIGAGFGGLGIIISKEFDIKSYKIIDLWEATMLQRKFISIFADVKKFEFFDTIKEMKNVDLVIAMRSWGELSIQFKERYFDKVISNSTNGFFEFGYGSDWEGSTKYLDDNLKGKKVKKGLFTYIFRNGY